MGCGAYSVLTAASGRKQLPPCSVLPLSYAFIGNRMSACTTVLIHLQSAMVACTYLQWHIVGPKRASLHISIELQGSVWGTVNICDDTETAGNKVVRKDHETSYRSSAPMLRSFSQTMSTVVAENQTENDEERPEKPRSGWRPGFL